MNTHDRELEIRQRLAEIEDTRRRLEAACEPYEVEERDTGICQDGAINRIYDSHQGMFDEEFFLQEELSEIRDQNAT